VLFSYFIAQNAVEGKPSTIVQWAGTRVFDQVWNNRESLTYSWSLTLQAYVLCLHTKIKKRREPLCWFCCWP